MLKVSHLTTGYGNRKVIEDISFNVDYGQLVLLTGGNGAGKSTVLKAIYGLIHPWKDETGSYGKIIYEGKDVSFTPTFQLLKSGVVYMPQKNNVFEDFTVSENLLASAGIYSKSEARCRVDDVMVRMPILAELKKRTPFSLSGGERQLLAFGCSLLHTPKLMLLDEPFAGVDTANSLRIKNEIVHLQKNGVSFIIIEHKINLFSKLDYKELHLELGTIKK